MNHSITFHLGGSIEADGQRVGAYQKQARLGYSVKLFGHPNNVHAIHKHCIRAKVAEQLYCKHGDHEWMTTNGSQFLYCANCGLPHREVLERTND